MSVQAISWVLDFSQSTYAARLVLISIANHCDKHGTDAWPTLETIAEEAHLGLRVVSYAINKLVDLGELEVEKGVGEIGRNRYTLPKMNAAKFAVSNLQSTTSVTAKFDSCTCKVRHRNKEEPSLTVHEPSLVLSPPAAEEGKQPTRFSQFKDMVFRFYEWKWKRTPPWDGADANQLSRLLKADPALELNTFAQWLKNYGESQDISPGERPCMFLPRITKYSVTALNQYGRSENVESESKQSVLARRNRDAFAKVFGHSAGKDRAPILEGNNRNGSRDLEKPHRGLFLEGD